jgi:hypothetical protein
MSNDRGSLTRRAWWWAQWQAWLCFHPPQDPDLPTTARWAWGRLGCFAVALVVQTATLMLIGIVWAWARWAFFGG